MKRLMLATIALVSLFALVGCETSGNSSPDSNAESLRGGCPADVSQADRYKYPDCDQ